MGVSRLPTQKGTPSGPALRWLDPFALAREQLETALSLPDVRRAIDAMPEQFVTLAGTACLQRITWYRNPWKTWAMLRCEATASGTRVRIGYAGNPALLLLVLIGIGITYATLPVGDATLYVCTLGGVLVLVGSFGRFIARDDVAHLHAAIVRAIDGRPFPPSHEDAT